MQVIQFASLSNLLKQLHETSMEIWYNSSLSYVNVMKQTFYKYPIAFLLSLSSFTV